MALWDTLKKALLSTTPPTALWKALPPQGRKWGKEAGKWVGTEAAHLLSPLGPPEELRQSYERDIESAYPDLTDREREALIPWFWMGEPGKKVLGKKTAPSYRRFAKGEWEPTWSGFKKGQLREAGKNLERASWLVGAGEVGTAAKAGTTVGKGVATEGLSGLQKFMAREFTGKTLGPTLKAAAKRGAKQGAKFGYLYGAGKELQKDVPDGETMEQMGKAFLWEGPKEAATMAALGAFLDPIVAGLGYGAKWLWTGGRRMIPTRKAPAALRKTDKGKRLIRSLYAARKKPLTKAGLRVSKEKERKAAVRAARRYTGLKPGRKLVEEEKATEAMKEASKRMSFEAERAAWSVQMKEGAITLYQKGVDRLHPLKKLVDLAKAGDVKVKPEEDFYALARLLSGQTGRANTFLEYGTFEPKFWKMVEGRARPRFKGPPLKKILKSLNTKDDIDRFAHYLTARHSKELLARDVEKVPYNNIKEAKLVRKKLERENPAFKEMSEKLYKYQDDVIDYVQKSGLLSKKDAAKVKKAYKAYIPFHRVLEKAEQKGYLGKSMVDVSKKVKRIKGSEKKVINPLENVVKNTYTLLDAAERNRVGRAMARLSKKTDGFLGMFEKVKAPTAKVATVDAKELGLGKILKDYPELKDKAVDIFRPTMFSPKRNIVTVLENGKREFYKTTPALHTALKSMGKAEVNMIHKALSYPAKTLRAGAILSPDFWINNPIRDNMTAWTYSKYGYTPFLDGIRGFFELVGKGDDFKLWRMGGGEYAALQSIDRNYVKGSVKELTMGKPAIEWAKSPLEMLRAFSEFGEVATRLGEAKKALASGANPYTAALASREVTLDFARMGSSVRSWNQIIAFLNANIQGIDKLQREGATAFKKGEMEFGSFAMRGFLGLTLPSVILWAANHDSPRYKEVPQWQKDAYWHFIPHQVNEEVWNQMSAEEKQKFNEENPIYTLRKPFTLGSLLASLPERALDYMKERDPEVLTRWAEDTLSGSAPSGLPTALGPIVEAKVGEGGWNLFYDRPIIPKRKQDLAPSEQATAYTSEFAKQLANTKVGRTVGASPMMVDHYIQGYFGGLGKYTTDGIDAILAGTGVVKPTKLPAKQKADYPIVGTYVSRPPAGSQSKSVNDFYNELEEATTHEKTLKEYIDNQEKGKAERYYKEHPEAYLLYDESRKDYYSAKARELRAVGRDLSDLRKKKYDILESDELSRGEKKKKGERIDNLITDVARKALEAFEPNEDGTPKNFQTDVEDYIDIGGDPVSESPILRNKIRQGEIKEKYTGEEGVSEFESSSLEDRLREKIR